MEGSMKIFYITLLLVAAAAASATAQACGVTDAKVKAAIAVCELVHGKDNCVLLPSTERSLCPDPVAVRKDTAPPPKKS